MSTTLIPETAEASVHELIRARWSPREFTDRPITAADLRVLFEAARIAASSFNEQPWRFIVATREQPEAYADILGTLVEANRRWAQTAPVLLVTAAKRTFARNGSPNYHALHDAGAALATLSLQAVAQGLAVHAMAGFDRDRARAVLGIPDDYEVGAAAAIGYPSSPDAPPRNRKPLSGLVFAGHWDRPATF